MNVKVAIIINAQAYCETWECSVHAS